MKKWVALIEVGDTQTPIVVNALDLDSAIKRLHIYLKAQNPGVWSDDWRDLREDIVEQGNQTLYGPYDDIPILI